MQVSGNSPGKDEGSTGIVGARTGGAPFDSVDLLIVGLQVMDTGVLLHAPNLSNTFITLEELAPK